MLRMNAKIATPLAYPVSQYQMLFRVGLFNRLGRPGNAETFLKVLANSKKKKKLKKEMLSYEQDSQSNKVTKLFISDS
jgi:hypothetical protein